MKELRRIFIYSIKLPQRNAAFAINRISMDKIIIYLFFLIAITSVPELLVQIQMNTESSAFYMQIFFLFIYFFMFYYLIFVCIIFAVISAIAYIGSWIARATKRKLRYSILWKSAACILTIPLILFTMLSFFYTIHTIFLIGAFVFHFIIFIQTIFLYPKRRHRSK